MSFETEDGFAWTANQLRMLRYMLEADGIQFMRYFFRLREGSRARRNWHHYVIQYVLDAVLAGKIHKLIINLAPGFNKTELAVINFIARGLAINPRSKYIHTSYSGDLAQVSSSSIKTTVTSPAYQELWPMVVRQDTKGKKRWFTELGGGMMTAPSGGQILGFRAGRMEPGFTGAFINDDPLKPDDAYSQVKRSAINNRFNNTMRSRLALDTTPFINIMQRLHEDDLTAFLLSGGSGDVWHHLSLPAKLSADVIDTQYPENFTHGIPININKILLAMHGGAEYEF